MPHAEGLVAYNGIKSEIPLVVVSLNVGNEDDFEVSQVVFGSHESAAISCSWLSHHWLCSFGQSA